MSNELQWIPGKEGVRQHVLTQTLHIRCSKHRRVPTQRKRNRTEQNRTEQNRTEEVDTSYQDRPSKKKVNLHFRSGPVWYMYSENTWHQAVEPASEIRLQAWCCVLFQSPAELEETAWCGVLSSMRLELVCLVWLWVRWAWHWNLRKKIQPDVEACTDPQTSTSGLELLSLLDAPRMHQKEQTEPQGSQTSSPEIRQFHKVQVHLFFAICNECFIPVHLPRAHTDS